MRKRILSVMIGFIAVLLCVCACAAINPERESLEATLKENKILIAHLHEELQKKETLETDLREKDAQIARLQSELQEKDDLDAELSEKEALIARLQGELQEKDDRLAKFEPFRSISYSLWEEPGNALVVNNDAIWAIPRHDTLKYLDIVEGQEVEPLIVAVADGETWLLVRAFSGEEIVLGWVRRSDIAPQTGE